MKRLLFVLLFPLTVAAQKNPFVLKGQIGQLGPDCHLYLTYASDGKTIHDTTHLQDGRFEFRGTINEVADALMILSTPQNEGTIPLDAIFFYIEKGTMEISGKDALVTAIFTAGQENLAYQELLARLKPIREKQRSIYRDYSSAPLEARHLPAFQASIAEDYGATRNEEKQVYLDFAVTHPNSVVSITALQWYANGLPDAKVRAVYDSLSMEVRSGARAKVFEKLLK
ncbi:DUF4369 domain-containing protein [Chitinophaga sp.]|uniref:DUF4369 domain-containing protein n=1 Tax=Chitinophaga sp. TaxID=1869181 RepID=UPI0031D068A7